MRHGLLKLTDVGLFCEAGGFYVDPWQSVERAVITHGHTDHAHWGHKNYLCSTSCGPVLKARYGADLPVETLAYDTPLRMGSVTVSLHPAGHVLGSAQVRLEAPGHGVTVISGDYKRDADATAEPFEPVKCDTFITESTFGLPIYRWPSPASVFDQINEWWKSNIEQGRTSIIYAYALGKAQRIIAGVNPGIGPILVHGAIARLLPPYEAAGVKLPRVEHAGVEEAKRLRGKALVVAPIAASGSRWVRKFAPFSDAAASGWALVRGSRRRLSLDRGFVLSDHTDWPGLMRTIEETGASAIGVTHGYSDVVARWLAEQGKQSFVVPTRFKGEAVEGETGAETGEVA